MRARSHRRMVHSRLQIGRYHAADALRMSPSSEDRDVAVLH